MKIAFTAGGTRGNFFPIIALVEELGLLEQELKLASLKLHFFSDTPYDSEVLREHQVKYHHTPSVNLATSSFAAFFSFISIFSRFSTLFFRFQRQYLDCTVALRPA